MLKNLTKRYLIIVLTSLFVAYSSLILFNYLMDPFRIFAPSKGKYRSVVSVNTRYVKTEFLSHNCKRFDSYILGDSRAVSYHTDNIDRLFNVNSYNFSVFGDGHQAMLMRLKWLIKAGCAPKMIVLPISVDLWDRQLNNANPNKSDLLRREHPIIAGKSKLAFWRDYLISRTAARLSYRKMRRSLRKQYQIDYNFDKGDVTYLWGANKESYTRCSQSKMRDLGLVKRAIQIWGEIKQVADKNNIEIKLVWNPQPWSTHMMYKKQDAEQFFSQLSGLFSHIYRLPVSDPRLKSSQYYHDLSHFKPELARDALRSKVAISQLKQEILQEYENCK